MKYVAITGASSGIGKALAFKFAKQGHNIIIISRNEEILESIKETIKNENNVKVIVYTCNLESMTSVSLLYSKLKSHDVITLINNAGVGDFSMPWDISLTKARNMLAVNVNALAELTLNYVIDNIDRDATVINISSVVGYYMYSQSAVYSATKFFVSSLTEGINRAARLSGKPLKAKVLAPAATISNFVASAGIDSPVDPNQLVSEGSFISAEKLADYAYELYISDKVVGFVNKENKIELKDSMLPILNQN